MPKVSELTAASAVTTDDLVPIVDAPGGTPATKKATVAQLGAGLVTGLTVGDILYYNGSALARLPIGSAGQRLEVVAGLPAWITSFDPALLTWEGWWRSSFASSPWAGTSSLGGSGSRNLTEATNPPAVGTALNGLTPADFDGTNDRLANATVLGSMLTNAAGTIVALFNADAATTDTGATTAYNMPFLVGGDAGGAVYLTFSTSGVRLGGSNSVPTHNSVAVAASTGAWHMAVGTWDATTLKLSVDGSAFSTLSFSLNAVDGSGSGTCVGRNYDATAFFNGRIAEAMVGKFTATTTDVANLKSYFNNRYALAL
jgi:hypothetical protein